MRKEDEHTLRQVLNAEI